MSRQWRNIIETTANLIKNYIKKPLNFTKMKGDANDY